MLAVAACETLPPSAVEGGVQARAQFSAKQTAESWHPVWRRVSQAAHEICRAEGRVVGADRCLFDLIIVDSETNTPNAESWIGPDGRSKISVDRLLLSRLRSADELAFVIAHEAAHSIASHHGEFGARNLSPGFTFGRRIDPKVELEADAIGTMLVMRAGFDPIKGSEILKRLYAAHPGETKTHPSLAPRLAVVKKIYRFIQDGGVIEID